MYRTELLCVPLLAIGLVPKMWTVLLEGCVKTSPMLRENSKDTT
jgi:hypothetical protein